MVATPWAILLCKFSDDASEPYPRQRYEELFTTAGSGKFNMVDFFQDMSHGNVDTGGSKVFGWYTLDKARAAYTGSGKNQTGRNELLTWARKAASDAGNDLSPYFNIVVVTNVSTDLFGGIGGAATDDGRDPDNGMSSLSPSAVGQEMSHGYGLNHSRADGSSTDYMDPWDIMSTKSANMAPHPFFTERDVRGNPVFLIGPGLNAANMWAIGWLDATRVWTSGEYDLTRPVQLRPLHRRDLPGYLCARVGDLFVEFRMNESWDGGFAAPAVFVHSYSGGHSYLAHGNAGRFDMRAGEYVSEGYVAAPPALLHGAGLKISVLNIDPAARVATIEVQRWRSNQRELDPGIILGGIAHDGGGWVVHNGKVVRIPPRSPVAAMLNSVVDALESESIRNGTARSLALQQAYEQVGRVASAETAHLAAHQEPGRVVAQQEAEPAPSVR